ncbi:J domain-containing protein [Maribacter algarum]|uniref:J domain-containing protein n=1 Tax=Maribacter algarum (ex Zhang et al. 2020) TaxID=2578118 RepID=UPI001486FD4D|nr:DnaJ domain-containing protein [Maribacter algarum]
MKDYYKILTVERSDSSATIKRVFRKLALTLHPDINKAPNAQQQFVDLNEAYQVLRNPIKRKQYNRLLDNEKIKKEAYKRNARKQNSRESSINFSAKKGKKRGEKFASESGKKFKRRTNRWKSSFLVDVFIEITFRALWALISSIFDF